MARIDSRGFPISAPSPEAEKFYQKCINLLRSARPSEVARVRGDGAEREVIEDALPPALLGSGDVWNTRDLLDNGLRRQRLLRDTRWKAEIAA